MKCESCKHYRKLKHPYNRRACIFGETPSTCVEYKAVKKAQ